MGVLWGLYMFLFLLFKQSGLTHAHTANPLDHHIFVFRSVTIRAFSLLGIGGAVNPSAPSSLALEQQQTALLSTLLSGSWILSLDALEWFKHILCMMTHRRIVFCAKHTNTMVLNGGSQ